MKGIELTKAIKLLLLVIITILFLTAVYSTEVPKSETIIIPGELNDSKETAQAFNNELEYVYGSTQNIPQKALSKSVYSSLDTITHQVKESWRKTTFSEAGTLVITLSYDIDSNYSIEVYNSCSNKNYCEEYEFGTYKTCVMNIEPGDYYFKVKNITGLGNYYLDVDLIKGKNLSNIDATKCINIECSKDKDCGEINPLDSMYCKNNSLVQKFSSPKCINPGKDDSKCESIIIEEIIQECETCFNQTCITQPTLNCPSTEINNNYSFTWNALDYNKSIYLELSPSIDFKTKKKISITKLNSLPIEKYFKTLINYEDSSNDNSVYARILAKNSNNKTIYSNICKIKTEKNSKSELICPTQPINEEYSFSFTTLNTTKNYLQISYDPTFSTRNTTKINTGKTNNTPISKYYKKILDYTNKSTNNNLYARIIGKDNYGRDTTSNTCEFKTQELHKPTLICPSARIDSSYSFNWNAGDYNKTVTLELAHKNDFKTKTRITATKLNPTPIQKKFKTLQNYSKKNTNGEIYARIVAKNKYNQTTTSNICTFKLNTTTLSKENEKNNTAYFGIYQETLQPTIEQMTDESKKDTNNYSLEISQRVNEDGETEEVGTYIISINQTDPNYLSPNLIQPLANTCLMGETGSTPCRSDLAAYNITINYTVYDEIRYKYIDCTTGEILGRGQLCPGETGPLHHRPDGHSVKFEYESYQCPNNLCRAIPTDLCSNVSCSNYCANNWKYYSGDCDDGVCNYSRTLCAAGCENGNCKTGCSSGCSNYCNGSRLYYNGYCSNSQCNYSSKLCAYGCSNGACKSQTCSTGWKCIDDETKGYRKSDCTWDDEEYCRYGCENGECNKEPISHDYSKCYNGDRYWYNSLDQREEKRQECGKDSEEDWEEPYCNGNTLERQRDIIDKYCSSDKCKSSRETQTEIIESCPEGCKNGACMNSPKIGDTDYCTQDKPCQAGLGNCKKNNDCEAGLICVEDAGSKYAYPSTTNVCEAPTNIYNNSGWTCKDPNTMAYLLSDGSYTNELPCKHGCSNGSCYMPTFCDAPTAELLELPKTQKLSFAGIDSNKEKIKLNAYLGEYMLSTAFVMVATTTIVMALIGTTILAYNNQVYESVNWPEYDDWTTEANFNQHYNDHKDEFGFKFDYEYRKECEENYRNIDSIVKQQYVENSAQGKVFIVRDAFSEMVSMVNESGKMFACYRVRDQSLESKLRNKGWTRLPKIPQCITII